MTNRTTLGNSVFDIATFRLLSDGRDITYDYEVLSLTVNHEVNRIPTAQVVLSDGSAAEERFEASEGDDFVPGKELEIALGYDSINHTVFRGIVVKHTIKAGSTGDSVLIVDSRDVAAALTIGRHSRYFKDMTDSEAIASIIQGYGPLTGEVEATSVKHREIVQYYATDWDFVRSRAEMNSQIVMIEDGTVFVKPPNTIGSAAVTFTYGANLIEFDAEMDARQQLADVKATAWDPAHQEMIDASAKAPRVNEQGDITGEQLAQVVAPKPFNLRHGGSIEQPELQAWADAQLLKSRLGKIRGRMKVKGYPNANVDELIELEGLGKRFNGLAYVSGVRHEMVDGSWWTYLHMGLNPQWFYQEEAMNEPPASGLLPGIGGLQIGVVVKLADDPLNADRVLVKSPIIDNMSADGIWARVATLDAGKQRGSFFRPEIGDEVVLGFVNDDPRHPVILGMLNSRKLPAPIAAKDSNHEKGFVTRSGMRVWFEDDKKVMILDTPAGNKVIISDDEKSITLTDQNRNSVILDRSGISLKSLKDIRLQAAGKIALAATQDVSVEGLNVNVNANTQFKAQGNSGAEVSTVGLAVIKGSLVQIN